MLAETTTVRDARYIYRFSVDGWHYYMAPDGSFRKVPEHIMYAYTDPNKIEKYGINVTEHDNRAVWDYLSGRLYDTYNDPAPGPLTARLERARRNRAQ